MTNRKTIPNADSLALSSKDELRVLGTGTSTKEAIQKALTSMRKRILKAEPTISAEEIVHTVSDLSKLVEGSRHSLASARMRTHLLSRGELKAPK